MADDAGAPMNSHHGLVQERRYMLVLLLVGVVVGALALGMYEWAGAARNRVAARSEGVMGKVIDDESGTYTVGYELDGRTFEKAFKVNNGPYGTPTDGRLRTMVLANAVSAFRFLVGTWGNGGG